MNEHVMDMDNAFQDCIERIKRGETIEDCLRDYPQEANELREMLQVVTQLNRVRLVEKDFSQAQASSKALLQQAIQASQPRRTIPRRFIMVAAAAAALLLIVFGAVFVIQQQTLNADTPTPPLIALNPTHTSAPSLNLTSIPATFTPTTSFVLEDMETVIEEVNQRCGDFDSGICHGRGNVVIEDANGQNIAGAVGAIVPAEQARFINPQSVAGGFGGIAVAKMRFDGMSEATTFVVFDGAQMRNEVGGGVSFTHAPTAKVKSQGFSFRSLREKPSDDAKTIADMPAGTSVRVHDVVGKWALIRYASSEEDIIYGWIMASALEFEQGLFADRLEPWQRLTITGSGAQPAWENAPAGGVLIQSPEGESLALEINGATVLMSSTALIRPQPGGGIRVISIEGHVAVRDSSGLVVNIQVGYYVDIAPDGTITTTTVTQISYEDGRGISVVIKILKIEVYPPLPGLTDHAIDVFDCEVNNSGPSGNVYVRENEPVILRTGYVDSIEALQQYRTHASEVTVNGAPIPVWSLSSIQPYDGLTCPNPIDDGAGGKICPLTEKEPHKTHFYHAYSVFQPPATGTYLVQWYEYQCTIVVIPSTSQTVTVIYDPRNQWQNTGIRLRVGQQVTISASGRTDHSAYASAPRFDANGATVDCNTLEDGRYGDCLAPAGIPINRLVGKIGDQFLDIGVGGTFTATQDGMLELAINDAVDYYSDNQGSLSVSITVNP